MKLTMELADQLEAKNPDFRLLDCLIYEALHEDVTPEMRGKYYGEWTGEYFWPEEPQSGFQRTSRCPEYTTDPGAAIKLALSLGAQEYEVQLVRGRGYGRVIAYKNGFAPDGKGFADTPAAALCSAIIRLSLSEYMQ